MSKTRMRGVVRDIDKYELSKYKIIVPIHFNKGQGCFFAEYLEQQFSAETVGVLKLDLDKYVRETIALPWVPVIMVNLKGSAYTFTDILNDDMHGGETYQRKHKRVDGKLNMHAERFWLAQRTDGEWMECRIWDSKDWDAEGLEADNSFLGTSDRRLNAHDFHPGARNFSLPFSIKESFDGGATFYMSYDENVWQALNAIGDRVREMNRQLQSLVATDDGRLKLQAFATRMLPAPKQTKAH